MIFHSPWPFLPRTVHCPFLPISSSPPPCVPSEHCLRPVPAQTSPRPLQVPPPRARAPALLACLPHSSGFSEGQPGSSSCSAPSAGTGSTGKGKTKTGCARAGSRLSPSVERQPPCGNRKSGLEVRRLLLHLGLTQQRDPGQTLSLVEAQCLHL